eukprot:m.9737 g.9737  ORF g.9737 m.9737 type:complete len:371 (+) comp4124_c0_seq1:3822-4934(+)
MCDLCEMSATTSHRQQSTSETTAKNQDITPTCDGVADPIACSLLHVDDCKEASRLATIVNLHCPAMCNNCGKHSSTTSSLTHIITEPILFDSNVSLPEVCVDRNETNITSNGRSLSCDELKRIGYCNLKSSDEIARQLVMTVQYSCPETCEKCHTLIGTTSNSTKNGTTFASSFTPRGYTKITTPIEVSKSNSAKSAIFVIIIVVSVLITIFTILLIIFSTRSRQSSKDHVYNLGIDSAVTGYYHPPSRGEQTIITNMDSQPRSYGIISDPKEDVSTHLDSSEIGTLPTDGEKRIAPSYIPPKSYFHVIKNFKRARSPSKDDYIEHIFDDDVMNNNFEWQEEAPYMGLNRGWGSSPIKSPTSTRSPSRRV